MLFCHDLCTDHSQCARPAVCDYYDHADTDGGFADACSQVCVPGTDEGCPRATGCVVVTYFRSTPYRSITSCWVTGDVAECEPHGGFACEPGLMHGAGDVCVRPCRIGETCPRGDACASFEYPYLDGAVEYGYCPCPVDGGI